jgi:hypothetical protein
MLSPSDISAVADNVAHLIDLHGVRFTRGTPQQYFKQLGNLSAMLTLPIVAEAARAQVLLLKNLCNLWNIIVDDELDQERKHGHLDASVELLLSYSRGQQPVSGLDSSAARVLNEVLTRLPTADDPHKQGLREMFFFDLWEEVNGFRYEDFINRVTWAATLEEYGKYSTMTASLKHFLDLDCLFAEQPPSASAYRQLREAYEHFGRSVKFASDLGTLKRELLEEDNLSVIHILARESGLMEFERKLELKSEAEYEALLPRLQPARDKARALVTTHQDRALGALKEAEKLLVPAAPQQPDGPKPPEVTTQLGKSLSGLIETYSKRDPFFHKPK